jgi:hypothetical protein
MFTRECPKCKKEIKHKSKYNCRDADKGGKVCMSCRFKGKSQKELYGERYEEILEKRSKGISKAIEKAKERDEYWHDKVTETRHRNGTFKHSPERRKQIAEQTVFKKKGKEHIHVKRYLKENNLTWEEYQSEQSEYSKYAKEVWWWTRKQDISHLPNVDKRGRAGDEGAYQLDHIIEISEGFVKGIDPKVIGDISNLQMITWEENNRKRKYPNGLQQQWQK